MTLKVFFVEKIVMLLQGNEKKALDNFRQWVFGTKNSHANIGKIESKIEVIKFFLNFLGGFFSRQRKSFENDTQHEMRLWSHLKHH